MVKLGYVIMTNQSLLSCVCVAGHELLYAGHKSCYLYTISFIKIGMITSGFRGVNRYVSLPSFLHAGICPTKCLSSHCSVKTALLLHFHAPIPSRQPIQVQHPENSLLVWGQFDDVMLYRIPKFWKLQNKTMSDMMRP